MNIYNKTNIYTNANWQKAIPQIHRDWLEIYTKTQNTNKQYYYKLKVFVVF